MNDLIQTITVYALPVLFAITLHEAAHAFAARYFGDMTAYQQGRMSLNPIKHIDILGTILIPIMMYLATSGLFLFGYAKPVPVDFSRLRHPKRDMAWVALAGPLANLFMAALWMAGHIMLNKLQLGEPFFIKMMEAGILVNLALFAFNLLPIPPLDGGRIAVSFLPSKYAYWFAQIEPYGFFVVLAMVTLGLLSFWMQPIVYIAYLLLRFIFSPFL